MKQHLPWAGALIFGAFFGISASASTMYTINLIDHNGSTVDGTGSFAWDGTAFSAFTVRWNTVNFDFTALANVAGNNVYACAGAAPVSLFTYLTTPNCQAGIYPPAPADNGMSWTGGVSPIVSTIQFTFYDSFNSFSDAVGYAGANFGQYGTFTVDGLVALPEPATSLLLSAGFLAVFVLRRKGHLSGKQVR